MVQDFWARAAAIPDGWPADEHGNREQAARLSVESEADSAADITISFLAGCGIPAFKAGTQGQVVLGVTGTGVDIYLPASRLEEARALLASQAPEEDN